MDDKVIMIVDDEPRMRKLIKDFLIRSRYQVIEAEDGEQAADLFFSHREISLILMDVMMPKMDGWETLKLIRSYSDVPIIMLTAKGEEQDELNGFKLGADDYITKPFSPKLLAARVDAILRRRNTEKSEIKEFGILQINPEAHIVKVDGKEVDLSIKEFELLMFFAENADIALSREKILNQVWNYDYYGDARTIDTHVKKLRSKLGVCGSYIKTIWGMGYKFEPEE